MLRCCLALLVLVADAAGAGDMGSGWGSPLTIVQDAKQSPATLIVEVTRAGVLGGPASTTRSVYRKSQP